jgi:RNA polymerase sigma factor (sigma-70 family)
LGGASDEELIRRSLVDPGSFEPIFERHHDDVYRYLRRRCGADTAVDLASETFTIAFARRADYVAAYDTARPWLFGIAHRLAQAQARHRGVEMAYLSKVPIQTVHQDPDPTDRLDAQRLGPQIQAALEGLKPDDRETFCLHVLGELTYQEVGAVLQIPIGTVRSRIHRAREALRELLVLLETSTGVEIEPDEGPLE